MGGCFYLSSLAALPFGKANAILSSPRAPRKMAKNSRQNNTLPGLCNVLWQYTCIGGIACLQSLQTLQGLQGQCVFASDSWQTHWVGVFADGPLGHKESSRHPERILARSSAENFAKASWKQRKLGAQTLYFKQKRGRITVHIPPKHEKLYWLLLYSPCCLFLPTPILHLWQCEGLLLREALAVHEVLAKRQRMHNEHLRGPWSCCGSNKKPQAEKHQRFFLGFTWTLFVSPRTAFSTL